MFRVHTFVISALFVYFLSFITGCPAMVEKRSATPPPAKLSPGARLLPNITPGSGDKQSEKKKVERRTIWAPGLLEKVLRQNRALKLFQDPLLESDSRPEKLLRGMEHSFTADISLLAATIAWCAFILLTLLALLKRHWFYQPMLYMVVPVSAAAIFVLLLSERANELFPSAGVSPGTANPLLMARAYMETLLFFGGLLLILHRFLPDTDSTRLSELKFMGHLNTRPGTAGARFRNFAAIVFQVMAIIFAGLLLANFILLPIFLMQLSFPGVFAILLAGGLLVLARFYTRAYANVSRSQHAEASYFSSWSFLGFRILRNSLFITSIIMMILIAVIILVILAATNIDILESINILKRPSSI